MVPAGVAVARLLRPAKRRVGAHTAQVWERLRQLVEAGQQLVQLLLESI
jgi:hypothetical protein